MPGCGSGWRVVQDFLVSAVKVAIMDKASEALETSMRKAESQQGPAISEKVGEAWSPWLLQGILNKVDWDVKINDIFEGTTIQMLVEYHQILGFSRDQLK